MPSALTLQSFCVSRWAATYPAVPTAILEIDSNMLEHASPPQIPTKPPRPLLALGTVAAPTVDLTEFRTRDSRYSISYFSHFTVLWKSESELRIQCNFTTIYMYRTVRITSLEVFQNQNFSFYIRCFTQKVCVPVHCIDCTRNSASKQGETQIQVCVECARV
eukprot:COSAG02_NODE_594_length_19849_cov_323.373114_12_plen_162_part_00